MEFSEYNCAEILETLLEDSPNLTWTSPINGAGTVGVLINDEDLRQCIIKHFSKIKQEIEKVTSWADVEKSFDSVRFVFTGFELHKAEMKGEKFYVTLEYRGFGDWGAWGA